MRVFRSLAGTSRIVAVLILTAASALAATPEWKSADPAYRIVLPRDHAAHPDFKIEWWYYTGNLSTPDGRRFGYQLTFFRVGVNPSPANPSRWTVRDLHLAHVAISDLRAERHLYADRLNRAGVGWAGADGERFRVWNEDWEATLSGDAKHRLRARDGRLALELTLDEGKPVVLQGELGYSRKGPTPGNASHYYSLTRMPTRGTLEIDGERLEVEGASWMDHEWGTSFLEAGQRGWDWFSLQLDDGRDLMLFCIRNEGGGADPYAGGSIVDAAGGTTPLRAGDFELTPGQTWRSRDSGAEYPVRWQVRVPREDLVLDVSAAFAAQELRTEQSTAVTYWEGAVVIRGMARGRPVAGRGYLEMTGYTGAAMSEVLR